MVEWGSGGGGSVRMGSTEGKNMRSMGVGCDLEVCRCKCGESRGCTAGGVAVTYG